MVKEFKTLSLLEILPESIRGDPQIEAAASALDAELQAVTADIKENLLISRIDELPERVLDLLAWQWHVDFYRPLGMDIDTKRRLIRESIAWHRIKGTPAAVEKVLAAAFVESWVEEWYEYGGSPGYFRVTISDVITDPEEQANILAAINSAKNERSWLDALRYLLVLKDELTASDLLALLEETGFIERYPWVGRFANGAYLAGGEHGQPSVMRLHGQWNHQGQRGSTREQNPQQVWPNIANGEYQADGSIYAKCWNHTGLSMPTL
ncbi:phage tail protein I [Selenomonas sp. AB3002]|uniref:phage tail protein I n=1 Tax=Selenomonas sp. AB3002 TaxID=1392502 RepID=UPI00068B90BC